MIGGLFMALLAGSLVSLQTIFNSKLNERAGTWATTTLVLGLGFVASVLIGWICEGRRFFAWHHMELWYWFSGSLGVGVVACLVQGMRLLGPTFAVSIVFTSQLGIALLLDSLGFLGMEQMPFTLHKLIGVLMIAGGIVVYKFSKKVRQEAA